MLSKYHHKKDKIKDNILCDILKRKYQFEQFEEKQPHVSGITERKGVKYYYTPVNNCVFFLPEVEKRRKDQIVNERMKRPKKELAHLTMEFLRLQRFLTLTEKDEYIRKCEEIQYEEEEYDEARIQIVENIYGLYKSAFAKSNLTLSDDELQFLKELITTQTPTLDFLGVTKPNSSFSRPFYFIEVKSSKSGFARASPFQKEL